MADNMQNIPKSEIGMECQILKSTLLIATVGMSSEEIENAMDGLLPTEKGNAIKSLADRLKNIWYQEGVYKGLLENIEFLLNFRFESQTETLMELIRKIEDIDRLRMINDAILMEKTADGLRDKLKILLKKVITKESLDELPKVLKPIPL